MSDSELDLAVRSAFAAFGASSDTSADGAGPAADAGESGVLLSAGERFSFAIARSSATSASVEITRDDQPPRHLTLSAHPGLELGSVRPIGIDDSGRAFVLVEHAAMNTDTPFVLAEVRRFSTSGNVDARFNLPIADSDFVPLRPVAVSAKGIVYFLRVHGGRSELLKLAPLTQDAPVVPPTLTDGSAAPAPGDAGFAAISRDQILQLAHEFESLEWTIGDVNYRADEDSECSPPGRKWMRPSFLDGKQNESVRGIPYNWGGKESVAQFRQRLASGAAAGNVCTCRSDTYSCVRQDATGVDCSGFLSQVWKVPAQGTWTLGRVAERVPWSELEPGDALNKPGRHVRLFLERLPNRHFKVLEASARAGRVRLVSLPLSQFSGYQGIRRVGIEP